MVCKPFLKWVGGKRQLMSKISSNMPINYNNYFEPFVGAGSVIFSMYDGKREFTISDFNSDLINLYRVIRDNPNDLMNKLDELKENINIDFYNEIRSWDRNNNFFDSLTPLEKASRFVYLNKTCFNGIYRVNKKNQFNVPFAKDKKKESISLYDKTNILNVSSILKDINIENCDFERLKPLIKENDFVYFDPPYIPLSKTSSFTSYTSGIIESDEDLQIRLKNFCDYLSENNIKFMLSNSSSPIALELYSNYKILMVDARRSINSVSSKRGAIKEIIVKNY